MRAEYGLRSYYEYLEKEWEAHGSWEVMPERDRSSSLLRATPPFPCLHCISRSARFITSSSSTSRGRQAEKAQKYPLRLHQHTMSQQSTSCWIRRCNRQYIFPRGSLSSAADRRKLSLVTASAAAGAEPRGANDHPNSLEKKGQPRADLFPTEKRLTMNALHSLENRARVLFEQTHNA